MYMKEVISFYVVGVYKIQLFGLLETIVSIANTVVSYTFELFRHVTLLCCEETTHTITALL